jgi:predicted peroxiredoxin
MSDKLIVLCSWGPEEPERATLAFIAANVAATAGQDVAVLCTIEGVRLGVEGGTEGVAADGIPPLGQVYSELVANGGEVWLCGVCTKPRNITEDQCAKGARIVGAAYVIEEITKGAKQVTFS